MNLIETLLERHWQELQDLRREYWGYALSTAPSDRERLQNAIARIYQLHEMEAPQVVWVNSLEDAKLCNGLGTYISSPRVHFSLRGPFGLHGGKEGFVLMHTPNDEKSHRERLQREFPTLYTEVEPQETVPTRIWNTFLEPNLDGGMLYRTLRCNVGIVSDDPLKIALRKEFPGLLPEGARPVSLLDGDSWGEPLPAILNTIDSAASDGFGQRIAEFDDAQWLDLWHRYNFTTETWKAFGSQFQQMSQEHRAEIRLFLRRITSQEQFGGHTPLRNAMTCARVKALETLGREHSFKIGPYTDAVKAGGWWWPFEGVCLAYDNPAEIHLDAQMRLHNEDGACIRFRDNQGKDDWRFWAVHGVRVPEIVAKNQFTGSDIETEPNSEVRRVMLNRYGISRYVMESGAEEIHKDEFGKLYRKNLPDGESICLVEVVDGTATVEGNRRTYHLCVPPEVTSAREAVAWTFGMSADEYHPRQES